MLRNVASQKWRVFAYDATTGLPKTGDAANISAYITKDDGSPAATNDAAPTEASSTNQPGYYDFDLTQAESDAAKLSLAPKSSTSNVVVIACPPVVYTRPQYFSLFGITSGGKAPATVAAGDIANNAITAAAIATGAIDADSIASDAITAAKIASDAFTAAKFASDVTTEFQNGLATATALATLQAAFDSLTADAGTAQAGASNSITLQSGASSDDGYYDDAAVVITAGTGAGQTRKITGYVGSTRVATVDENWVTDPDNTSEYKVIGRIV